MFNKHNNSARSESKINAKSISIGKPSPATTNNTPLKHASPEEHECVEYPSSDLSASLLLNALWQSDNLSHQLGVMKKTGNNFINIPVDNVTVAVKLSKKLSEEGWDVYFACSEYKTPENRCASNVAGACAFLMDIDCGEDKATAGKGYRTKDEARCAITTFRETTGLPYPTHIVDSGSGLHVYWRFDCLLPRDDWKVSAKKLKKLTKACDFKADDARTADIASVLRVPGTLNYKYSPPRPVSLIHTSDDVIQMCVLLDAIDTAYNKLCTTPEKKTPTSVHKPARSALTKHVFTGSPQLERLASALACLDPDCNEETWKLRRISPIALEASKHPELSNKLYNLARSWSSGVLRGYPSVAWSTPGGGGVTGEEEFDSVWLRFLDDNYDGIPVTIATIYYDAKQIGWEDTEDQFQIFSTCVVEAE